MLKKSKVLKFIDFFVLIFCIITENDQEFLFLIGKSGNVFFAVQCRR